MIMPISHIGMISVAAVSFIMYCCRTSDQPVQAVSTKNSTEETT